MIVRACGGLGLSVALALWLPVMVLAEEPEGEPGTTQRMDYGPVIGETIRCDWPEGNTAYRGLAIRLDYNAAVIFDKNLLRWAAATEGGWIDTSGTDLERPKGQKVARSAGRQTLGTERVPGWAKNGRFKDPRSMRGAPLPRAWARYRGYHRHGERIVLRYTVGGTRVLESPEAVKIGNRVGFVRRLRVSPGEEAMRLRLCDVPDPEHVSQDGDRVTLRHEGRSTIAGLVRAPEGAELSVQEDSRLELRLPPRQRPVELAMVLARLPAEETAMFEELRREADEPTDLESLTGGGPTRWDRTLRLEGERAEDDAAYVVDTIPVPIENPWGAMMRLTGFDFFEGGKRAAVCTMNGDVWLVDGLDDDLDEVAWKRYASGLFQPLGLVVRDGAILVLERGQITRLRDFNGDGEADEYACFNGDGNVHPRAFWTELQEDPEGHLYYFKNGNRVPRDVPMHGCVVRVAPDGSESEVFATGFRSANGMGVAPDGTIHTTDQQGDWVPATRIDRLRRGRFYGHRPHGGGDKPVGEFRKPICWVPHHVDNSAGDQAYAPDERWGPLAGRWVHTSWGQCRLFAMLTERVEGRLQGGVFPMPIDRFSSGVMRSRFNPHDGQLYVLGMRGHGWQTIAPRVACFNRVRYTGEPAHLPVELHATERGVRLTFSDPLAPEAAGDPERYSAHRWTYRYSSEYGSPLVSVEDPEEEGRDELTVSGVEVSEDRRSVLIRIPDMRPARQMRIRYQLRGSDGQSFSSSVYHTVHRLGPGAE